MLPLREAAELPHYIHGASVETLGLNNILLTHGGDITSRLQSGTMSLDDCANHLCHQLSQNQVEIDCLHVHEGYVDTEDTKHNIEIWQTSHNLDDARPKLRSVSSYRAQLRNMMLINAWCYRSKGPVWSRACILQKLLRWLKPPFRKNMYVFL